MYQYFILGGYSQSLYASHIMKTLKHLGYQWLIDIFITQLTYNLQVDYQT